MVNRLFHTPRGGRLAKVSYALLFTLLFCLLGFGCARNAANADKSRKENPTEIQKQADKLFSELEGGKEVPGRVSSNPLTNSTYIPKPGQMVSVEIDTFRVYNDNTSVKDARAQTLQFIRQCAMEKALPTEVNLTSLTASMAVERNAQYDESIATGIFMMSSSAGRFVKEEILKATPVFEQASNTLRYAMHYRAEILPVEKVFNPSLTLDIALSETLIKSGENFSLAITPNADGYLYLFDFYADGSAALVFPTVDNAENSLRANEKWNRTLGAICDPEKDYSIETLYFVYSTKPINGWEDFRSNRSAQELVFSAGEESFIMFQQWLGKCDPVIRIEKMAQLHIFR
ncbi:MAG: DUF4384 domain-containing protein [Candidatus Cloacimonas sp.]|jgi:hypothetical protein|nr:DUF4384 domain-containing protein [Candidatus Cloacimonas sp.]